MSKYLVFIGLIFGIAANGAETSVLGRGEVNNVDKIDQIGVGLQVGTTTGVNLEYWLYPNTVLTGAVGVEHTNGIVTVGSNYMFRGAFAGSASALTPYVGGGALASFGTNSDYLDRTPSNRNFALALQVPLGLAWLPAAQRFDIFAQIAPSAEVTPVLLGFMAADLGAHFYF